MATCTRHWTAARARLRSHAGACRRFDCHRTVWCQPAIPGLSERVRTSPKTLVHNRSRNHRRAYPCWPNDCLWRCEHDYAYSCRDCHRHEVAILARRRRRESMPSLAFQAAISGQSSLTYCKSTQSAIPSRSISRARKIRGRLRRQLLIEIQSAGHQNSRTSCATGCVSRHSTSTVSTRL